MRRLLIAGLLLIPACDRKDPAATKPVEPPSGWSVEGTDLEKGASVQYGSPQIHATIKRVATAAPKSRREWHPHVLSSDVQLADLEEQTCTVSGHRAYRVHYLYREFGKPPGSPYDRHAVEACVERDTTTSYEILILFSDGEAAAALPQVDRFLKEVRIKD